MPAIQKFREALENSVDKNIRDEILEGYEKVSDRSKKSLKAEFFAEAMDRMDRLLSEDVRHGIRDSCACSKGGWRLKAMQRIAKEYDGKTLEEKLEAIRDVMHMGNPVLTEDEVITAGIGDVGGFECPCPVFSGSGYDKPVSITYCYCCGGHFRYHYQIALGVELETVKVESSSLESVRTKPCRFVYRLV